MEYSKRGPGERKSDGGNAAFPHVFHVRGRHIEDGLNLAAAMEGMKREQGGGLCQVYASNSEAVLRDSGSMSDYRLYQVGFALTVDAIRGALAERGEPMPTVPDDPFSIRRYERLTRDDPAQYGRRLALLQHEGQLLEAVDAEAPIDPDSNRWGGDYVPLYDGVVAAYWVLSDAAVLARVPRQLDDEVTGFVGQLAAVDVLR